MKLLRALVTATVMLAWVGAASAAPAGDRPEPEPAPAVPADRADDDAARDAAWGPYWPEPKTMLA